MRKLLLSVGSDDFYPEYTRAMVRATNRRDMHSQKKLRDLEWRHLQIIRGEKQQLDQGLRRAHLA